MTDMMIVLVLGALAVDVLAGVVAVVLLVAFLRGKRRERRARRIGRERLAEICRRVEAESETSRGWAPSQSGRNGGTGAVI